MVKNKCVNRFGLRQMLLLAIGMVAIPVSASNIRGLQQRAQSALGQGDIQGALQAAEQMGGNRQAQANAYRTIAQVAAQLQQRLNVQVQQLSTSQAAVRTAQGRQQQAERRAIAAEETAGLLQQALVEAQQNVPVQVPALDAARMQELQAQLERAHERVQELEQVENNVGQLITDMEAHQAEDAATIAALQAQLDEREADVQQAGAQERVRLEQELAAVRERCATLQRFYEEYREATGELRSDNDVLQARLEAVQQEREAAIRNSQRAQQALARMTQERAAAQTAGREQATRLAELMEQNQALQASVTRVQEENEVARQSLEELKKEREEAIIKSDRTQQELVRMAQERAAAQTTGREQATRLAELMEQNKALRAAVARVQEESGVAGRSLVELKNELEEARDGLTKVAQEREAAICKSEQAQQALARMTQERAAAQTTGREQATRLAELEQRTEALQEAVTGMERERNAAVQSHQEAQQQCARLEVEGRENAARIEELERMQAQSERAVADGSNAAQALGITLQQALEASNNAERDYQDQVADAEHNQNRLSSQIAGLENQVQYERQQSVTRTEEHEKRIKELEQRNEALLLFIAHGQQFSEMAASRSSWFNAMLDQLLSETPALKAVFEQYEALDACKDVITEPAIGTLYGMIGSAVRAHIEQNRPSREQAEQLNTELASIIGNPSLSLPEFVQKSLAETDGVIAAYLAQLQAEANEQEAGDNGQQNNAPVLPESSRGWLTSFQELTASSLDMVL